MSRVEKGGIGFFYSLFLGLVSYASGGKVPSKSEVSQKIGEAIWSYSVFLFLYLVIMAVLFSNITSVAFSSSSVGGLRENGSSVYVWFFSYFVILAINYYMVNKKFDADEVDSILHDKDLLKMIRFRFHIFMAGIPVLIPAIIIIKVI